MNDMHNKVLVRVVKADDGTVHDRLVYNLRPNGGTNFQCEILGSDRASGLYPRVPIHIGVSEDTDAPVSGDTNLVGEINANGISRETGTFSHTADQSLYTLSVSWKYTGGSVLTIAKAGMASRLTNTDDSTDTHFLVTAVSPVAVLDTNDTLAIDWGVNV